MTSLDFDKGGGLIPAVVQDDDSRQVLMLGYMNQESLERTIQEGRVWFYSRSKGRLWLKGETSGHILEVKRVAMDCDADAILISVRANGPACHLGFNTCFYRDIEGHEVEPHPGV